MKSALLLVLLTALLPFSSAQAAPVTFAFTGTIDNDPFGVFDTATFDGSYTFDPGIPEVLDTANSAGYADSGGIYRMTVSFTGTLDPSVSGPYVADALNITVNNDFPGPLDEYLVTGTSSADSALSIELRLDDFTGAAFSSTALPLAPPKLASFTSLGFALFGGTLDTPVEAEGVLTSLKCTVGCTSTAPEPNVLILMVAALAAWWLGRFRAPARVR